MVEDGLPYLVENAAGQHNASNVAPDGRRCRDDGAVRKPGGAVFLPGSIFGIARRWLRVPDEDVKSRHVDEVFCRTRGSPAA